jgi:tetraacyldisaccharide 4'-kinase
MSAVLLPLVPLYAAAIAAKNFAWDRGWLTPGSLDKPVVSIGNLSVGGSGKTPLTIRLVQLLRERAIQPDVLSRGYGRRSTLVEAVDPAGSAEEFGDEPLLIAQAAAVPVYVGASRYEAGRLAESKEPTSALHLLDDGFQHRKLARDVDIVVLHRSDFSSHLLPAGRLREGFSSLRRAHIIVMREEDRDYEAELRRRHAHQPLWWMVRRLSVPPLRNAVAFCSIARPNEFFSALRAQGFPPAATRAWIDHHRYAPADIAELLAAQRQHKAEAFLTTEKDLARLSPEQRRALELVAPLQAVPLVLRLHDEPACLDQLLALLPASVQPRRRRPPQTP